MKGGANVPIHLEDSFLPAFPAEEKNGIRAARTNNRIIILYDCVQFTEINLEFNIPTEFHT